MTRRRVAVLGGGIGGLSAAWALSATAAQRRRFEVTVYTLGFRLGGKGASARAAGAHERIEEHGLHLLMGCYDNFFRIMRDCYGARDRDPRSPLSRFDDAFTPRTETVLTDLHRGRVHRWRQRFPKLPTRPGDGAALPGPVGGLAALLQWALRAVAGGTMNSWQPGGADGGRAGGGRTRGHAIARWLRTAQEHLPDALVTAKTSPIVVALSAARAAAQATIALPHPQARRAALSVDFLLTNALGVLADGLVRRADGAPGTASYADWLSNLERIDHLEYREWLASHGAHPDTLDGPIVRGFEHAVFSEHHGVAAGVALHGIWRMNLTYRGALFYEMAAGMGETVFTPLYRTLRARGVIFRFFHRVEGLGLSADARRIESVRFVRQAQPIASYEPLRTVQGHAGPLEAWPTEPDYDQLHDGDALRKAGVDFESACPIPGEVGWVERDVEDVVLAVPVGALAPITTELARANPAWEAMLANATTTATQSLQLWLGKPLPAGAAPQPGQTVTGFAEPLTTWADMSHLSRVEAHPKGSIGAQLYACGAARDPIDATALERRAAHFERETLPKLQPSGAPFPAAVDRRFVVNDRPWERYVVCPPGSPAHRLTADGSGLDNLALAGDWVRTPFNIGCIEAATMAGLRAARALGGHPTEIHGDPDRPARPPTRPAIAALPVPRRRRPPRTSPTFFGEARVLVDAPLAEIAHIIDPSQWSTHLRQVVVSRVLSPGLIDGRGRLHEEVDVLTPDRARGSALRLRCLLDVAVTRTPTAKTVQYRLHRSLDASLTVNEGELSIEGRGPTASVVRVTKRLRVSGHPLLRAMLTFNPDGLSSLMQQWLLEAARNPGRSRRGPTAAGPGRDARGRDSMLRR